MEHDWIVLGPIRRTGTLKTCPIFFKHSLPQVLSDMSQRSFARIPLFCLVAFTGCSVVPQPDYGKLKLVDAYGKVTLDGQPLPNAVITFEAPDGQFSYALTDSAGKYTLQLDSEKAGVTPGQKIVRISTTRKILGLNAKEGEGEGDPVQKSAPEAPKELVPEKFNKKSELQVEVTADKRDYNFDLKST